jgi:hypothetical protein
MWKSKSSSQPPCAPHRSPYLGSIAGPILASIVMQLIGPPPGFFVTLALICAGLAGVTWVGAR